MILLSTLIKKDGLVSLMQVSDKLISDVTTNSAPITSDDTAIVATVAVAAVDDTEKEYYDESS